MTRFIQRITLLLIALLITLPCLSSERDGGTTLAFGSCLRQWQPQPVWESVLSLSPRAFVFTGDNVYTDTGPYEGMAEPERIGKAYRDLANTEAFRRFRDRAQQQGTALLATWDDHDYGRNDAGGDYPHKLASKGYFLDFFDLEKTATGGPDRAGVYHSRRLSLAGLDVQVILLDTRSFRSPLIKGEPTPACPAVNNLPNERPDATLLGHQQWRWLGDRLREPADLRLLVSSIQVLPSEHCFEKWANFPAERQRLLSLIRDTGAGGVVILSGDRHLGEISKMPAENIGYPLYEITSSGLNSAMNAMSPARFEDNALRTAGDNLLENHFGTLRIQHRETGTRLLLQLRDVDGDVERQASIPLAELSLPTRTASP